ncbi:hypothetical protein IAQ61_001655 [Plenodomus lingam]|uniref:uncharacterized protein n=1 Tax=Leptosphaeria maculans TaxID=5022 RepID=UPI00331A0FE8|nr:hypothetical protein IAQ61_001655 [Plenodomus lingam]
MPAIVIKHPTLGGAVPRGAVAGVNLEGLRYVFDGCCVGQFRLFESQNNKKQHLCRRSIFDTQRGYHGHKKEHARRTIIIQRRRQTRRANMGGRPTQASNAKAMPRAEMSCRTSLILLIFHAMCRIGGQFREADRCSAACNNAYSV